MARFFISYLKPTLVYMKTLLKHKHPSLSGENFSVKNALVVGVILVLFVISSIYVLLAGMQDA